VQGSSWSSAQVPGGITVVHQRSLPATYTYVPTCDPVWDATAYPSASSYEEWSWDIAKSVDHQAALVSPGSSETFRYTVIVTPSPVDGSARTTVTVGVEIINRAPFAQSDLSGILITIGGAKATYTLPAQIGPSGTAIVVATREYPSALADGTTIPIAVTLPDGSARSAQAVVSKSEPGRTVILNDTFASDPDAHNGVGIPDGIELDAVDGPFEFTYTVDLGATPAGEDISAYPNTACIVGDEVGRLCDRVTVEVVRGKDLSITKVATATATLEHAWAVTKQVWDGSGWADYAEQAATGRLTDFTYRLTATPLGSRVTAINLSGVVFVKNPNGYDVEVTSLTFAPDLPSGAATCTYNEQQVLTVPAGATNFEIRYDCDFTEVPSTAANALRDGSIAATLTWNAAEVRSAEGEATATFPFEWAITRAQDTLTVSDDLAGQSWTFDYAAGSQVKEYQLSHECGTVVTNTAVSDLGHTDTADALALCPLTVAARSGAEGALHYEWAIDKLVTSDSLVRVAPGQGAAFDYLLTVTANPVEDTTTATVVVTLSNPNPVTQPVKSLVISIDGEDVTPSHAGTLGAGMNTTVTATKTWPGTVQRSVVVTVRYDGDVILADTVAVNPTITGQQAILSDEFPELAAQNSGRLTLFASEQAGPTEWTLTYTAERGAVETFEGTTGYPNQACLAIDGSDRLVCDSATVAVVRGLPLAVDKTVEATYSVDHQWTLTKEVCAKFSGEPGSYTCDGGWASEAQASLPASSAGFLYRVTATPDGDGAITAQGLRGKIVITNPNGWDVAVTKVIDLAVVALPHTSCTVADAPSRTNPLPLQAGGQVELDYACTFSVFDSATSLPGGFNTVVIAWDNHSASETSAFATRRFDFASAAIAWVRSDTNYAITVTDTLTEPFGGRFDAGASVNEYVVDHECGQYVTNTASSEATASASTTALVPCPLSARAEARATAGRSYSWDISKSASPAEEVRVDKGQDATFDYQVAVTATVIEGKTIVTVTGTLFNDNPLAQPVDNLTVTIDGRSVATDAPAMIVPGETAFTATATVDGVRDVPWTATYAGNFVGHGTVQPTVEESANQVTLSDTFAEFDAKFPGDAVVLTASPEELQWVFEYTAERGATPTDLPHSEYPNTACLLGSDVPQQCADANVKVVRGLDLTATKLVVGTAKVEHAWDLVKQICDGTYDATAGTCTAGAGQAGWTSTATQMADATGRAEFAYRVIARPLPSTLGDVTLTGS
ncbi:MAG: hypothetical protein FWG11_07705, partial [Promicromonosporaceae bacterium]|nr:hypothetical protein [Promicromonosporaceae bacterium]